MILLEDVIVETRTVRGVRFVRVECDDFAFVLTPDGAVMLANALEREAQEARSDEIERSP